MSEQQSAHERAMAKLEKMEARLKKTHQPERLYIGQDAPRAYAALRIAVERLAAGAAEGHDDECEHSRDDADALTRLAAALEGE